MAQAAPCKDATACDPGCERACEGVALPSAIVLDGKTLCLNGMGVREATIFNVDVYVAGLYLERRSTEGEAIARSLQPKVMRLRFVRNVERGEIAEAIQSGFQRAAGALLPKLKPSIERFAAALPELKRGDTLTLTYRVGRGVELSHNGKVLTEIAGDDFAAALFRIWLGDHPPNEGLRTGLLGGRCG
jgi:hypothetical protein